MKSAIVTGASRGIGEAISKNLLLMGYRVFGMARNFEKCSILNTEFFPVKVDLTDFDSIQEQVKMISKQASSLDVLVNNAGVGFFGPHDTLSVKDLIEMVDLNLTAPMILSRLLLPKLRESKGCIINISSSCAVTPKALGAAYGATKAGLSHFGDCLFEEVRKQGIRVVAICPDLTDETGFYENAFFEPVSGAETSLLPEQISELVKTIISQPQGVAITKMVVWPQKFQLTKRKPIS